MNEHAWLTYREAAKRVHRSRNTIRWWKRQGMPTIMGKRNGQMVVLVEVKVLLAWWRGRMRNNPIRLKHDTPSD